MDENQYYTIVLRHDTSTLWMTNDPILRLGELGVEDDTHKVKRGDGESKWSELPYEDFGLVYIVTFENLHGDLEKNETLVEEFDKKVNKKSFADVGNKVVATLLLTNEEEGEICRITRMTKDVTTDATVMNVLQIYSEDNSIQGYWSLSDDGAKILNLVSRSAICDYEPSHTYFKDQICYFHNKLYRAYEDIVAGPTFNENQWVLLASLHSNDIKYDNLISGLDSGNVKDALDELKRRDDRKVQKSTEERIVYGTDKFGQQTVIPIDDLRKVDTVNHKQADLSKNVQLDAGEINYSDAHPEYGSIRKVLDEKVDKNVAGKGARIVRDVQFEYDETNGHIKLIEDKVSLENGTSATEEREIDVVAEKELEQAVQDINDRIDEEVDTLNTRIDTEVETLNTRIDEEVETLNNTINVKEAALYNKIQEEHDEINQRVDEEVETLNNTITTKETESIERDNALGVRIDETNTELARVEKESKDRDTDIHSRIDTEVETLNTRIDNEVDTLNGRVDNEVETLNTRIDTEVNTLNNTITEKDTEINARIDNEVETLNNTITEKDTAMDNKKIDKDISEYIVTAIDVVSHESQPTIRFTSKHTETKSPVYDYAHFGTQGAIKTRMEDADHLIIDSSDIDEVNAQQNARLTNAENRLTAHDGQIATLLEHDVNHDRQLATINNQIAIHEERLDTDEENITTLQHDLETEAGTRESSDNALSGRITTNTINITTKSDKIFAQDTDNKVIGKLESDTISGDVLLNLKETLVSPQDNSSSVERIRVISSDNTVIANRLEDGTIDIKTNLDTDVNYFVTTEIISTTIADETTLNIAELTATDKTEVEIQDIVSDPEGTWGRVKSIDGDNNTCIVVTFKKHAQAVWGTIKGNIADQTDLQTQLSEMDNRLQDNIDTEASARQTADTTLQANIDSLGTELNNAKVDKTVEVSKIYGTDEEGNQTIYDKDSFGKVDTVNNVQPDENKNVTLTGRDIKTHNVDSESSIADALDYFQNTIEVMINSVKNRISGYTTGKSYKSEVKINLVNLKNGDTTEHTISDSNFVTFVRDDGVMLMAKIMNDFESDNTLPTAYESFMLDVEIGNLKLVGIPEQVGENN